MSLSPVVDLAVLRDWGARYWDPASLAGQAGRENAYDSFLLAAFGRLRAGEGRDAVIDDLTQVELELRGVRQLAGAAYKARLLVDRLEDYAASLPPGPLRVEAA